MAALETIVKYIRHLTGLLLLAGIIALGLASIILKDQYFYTGNIDTTPQPVPVPPSVALLASGLIGLLGCGRVFKGFMARTRPE
jgi:hypothetical protein